MELQIDVEGTHQGAPVKANIKLKFDKGEYIAVIKEMPSLISQINQMVKMDQARAKMRKAQRKGK